MAMAITANAAELTARENAIAALAARPKTEPQMKAHIAIGKMNGVTDAQAAEIVRRVQLPRNPADLPRDWSPIPVDDKAYAEAAK